MFHNILLQNLRIFQTTNVSRKCSNFRLNSLRNTKTIYALSSGYGKCGVAVIRISGSQAIKALQEMTNNSKPVARKAYLRNICDPGTNEVLDRGLCLWFPGPNSFTGEDVVEFHVHGGRAVITSVLQALTKLRFEHAQAGEFTRRAFLNGKMDLTEAEGIRDVIDADTDKQRRQASVQASGSLRRLYDAWRRNLLYSLAALEAYIDFAEEHDVPDLLETSKKSLEALSNAIEKHLQDGRKGEILRDGIRVVIIGEPNAGKSSLINLVSGKDAAIVTAIPGTTRDVVEVVTDVCGYPMILADTAGIRGNPSNEIEEEGIRRSFAHAQNANLVIVLLNAEKVINFGRNSMNKFIEEERKKFNVESQRVLMVLNKIDLIDGTKWWGDEIVGISCKTKQGLDELTGKLEKCFVEMCGDPTEETPVISHARYRNHLSCCLGHVRSYLEKTKVENYDIAICLQEIRFAVKEIGKITGHVGNEEILDVIFKNFCVGK